MDRREVLRMLATGAALQLAPHKMLVVMREARALLANSAAPRALNAHQYATVKQMAEMILPATETPGASDVGVGDFIDLILTEWNDEGERARFIAGLDDVDARSKKLFGNNFVDGSAIQRSEILVAFGEKMAEDIERFRDHAVADAESPDASFYSTLRRLTLTAYYTSEAGATQELHFEIIPGDYNGCETLPAPKETGKQP